MQITSEPPVGSDFAMAYRAANVSSAATSSSQEWDVLRKEARKLEGELDVKLAAYAKLCSGYDGHRSAPGGPSPSPEQILRTKAAEIEASIQRLSDVNEKLGSAVSSGDSSARILARHRDILQEFAQESRRLNSSVGAARDRAELLSGSSEGAPLLGVQVQGTAGALLRERNTVQSSTAALDDVIGQAEAVSGSLKEQRHMFDRVSDKLLTIGGKFPVVNGLLKAIGRKKSRDTIVLASVIAACLLFLVGYIFWR
ncbi:hypothetical protein BSKO_07530 [Bryopsis sp. KO-2023]|nr:hypothetical protein BSKO_07530 [Bryopsis sp. KO-2023]